MSENRFAVLNQSPEPAPTSSQAAAPEPRAKREQKAKPQPTARATGKSSQAGYERLTVYVPKAIKQDLERSLVGTGQDMSDVVGALLTKHLNA